MKNILSLKRWSDYEAKHWYAKLKYTKDRERIEIELKRVITPNEIKNERRFYSYKDGQLVNCFLSYKDALLACKEKCDELKIDYPIIEGLNNYPHIGLMAAIYGDLDVDSQYCEKCGRLIKDGDVHYGTICLNNELIWKSLI